MLHLNEKENLHMHEGDSTDISLLDPVQNEWDKVYVIRDYSLDPYFDAMDTGHTTILGKDIQGKPDFITDSLCTWRSHFYPPESICIQ